MVVSTVVPFGIDGRVTATALPLVIVSVLLDVARVNFVVGVFLVAIARKVLLLNGVWEAEGLGFGVGEAEGLGVGVGDAEALGEGVGVGVGVAAALGEGVGVAEALGDGVGVGEGDANGAGIGKPPPPKPPPPPPPPLVIIGAAAIVKVLIAAVAAKNLVVADALAVIVQEPAEVSVTVEPEIVQLPLAVKVTGVPEEDVAEIITGPGIVWGEIVGKLIDCATFTTLKFFDDAPASKFPDWLIDAVIEQVPADTPVTTPVDVSKVHTELGDTVTVTAPPDGAVAVTVTVESMGTSLIVAGEITGSFAVNADVAATTWGEVAAVLSLSPTRFTAETFTL